MVLVADLSRVVSLEPGVLRSLFGISFLVFYPLFIVNCRSNLLLSSLLQFTFAAIIVAIVCFCSRLLNFLVEAIGSTIKRKVLIVLLFVQNNLAPTVGPIALQT